MKYTLIRIFFFGFLIALTAFTFVGNNQVKQDSNPAIWIDPHIQASIDRDTMRTMFPAEPSISILLEADDVLGQQQLQWIKSIQQKMLTIPYIESVLSVLNAHDLAWDELGPAPISLVRDNFMDAPLEAWERDIATQHPLYSGLLIAKDAHWTMLVIKTKANIEWSQLMTAGNALQELVNVSQPPTGLARLTGLPIQQQEICNTILSDQKNIMLWSALSMLTFITFLFLHPQLILIPFCSLATSVGAIGAVLFFTDQTLNAVIGLLPPLIAAISIATSLHLIDASMRNGSDHPLKSGLKSSAIGIACASITTAIGFAGLISSDLVAVHTFGIYACIGVVLAVASAYAWTILLLPWGAHPLYSRGRRAGMKMLEPVLESIGHWSIKNRTIVILSWLIIGCLASYLLSTVRTDNDLLSALPQRLSIVQSQRMTDKLIGGSIPMELSIGLGHALTQADIDNLRLLQQDGNQLEHISHLQSIVDIIDYVKKQAELADDPQENADVINDLKDFMPDLFARFVYQDQTQQAWTMRLTGLSPDQGLDPIVADYDRLTAMAHIRFPQASIIVNAPHRLLKQSADRFLPNIFSGLAWVLPAIFLMTALTFRRIELILAGIVTMLMPAVIGLAVLPLLDWPMDLPQTMISCLVIGIVVDDVVHWLLERHRRKNSAETNRHIGPVLLGTSLILIAASACFLIGEFEHTQRFGLVMSATFICAIALTLTLLPALFGNANTLNQKDAPDEIN